MTNSSICVLVSGGLDSDVLLARLALNHRQAVPVYIQQGLKWEETELYWLDRYIKTLRTATFKREDGNVFNFDEHIAPLEIFSLPMGDVYGAHWSTGQAPVPGANSPDEAVYLPGRNMSLSVKAAVYCAIKRIPLLALGTLGGNPFPDARREFWDQWTKSLSMGLDVPLSVLMPYRVSSKKEVVLEGRYLPLHLSFSCIDPQGREHCGRCNKCAERQKAFQEAAIEDQTTYAA
jgi:7-cyano-7-deazaguanine synthase